eukprot:768739-Hanusia_phi.AAC.14
MRERRRGDAATEANTKKEGGEEQRLADLPLSRRAEHLTEAVVAPELVELRDLQANDQSAEEEEKRRRLHQPACPGP